MAVMERIKKALGIGPDMRKKLDQLDSLIGCRDEAVKERKRLGADMELMRRKFDAGEIHIGQLNAAKRTLELAQSRERQIENAITDRKNLAPAPLRHTYMVAKKKLVAATTTCNALRREIADAELKLADAQERVKAADATKEYPGKRSTFPDGAEVQWEADAKREALSAERALLDAQFILDDLRQRLAETEQAAIEYEQERLDAERAMLTC